MILGTTLWPWTHPTPPVYAAVGDSIAAGSALPESDGSTCSRSPHAYPKEIAARLHADLEQQACGGANVHSTIGQVERVFSHGRPDVVSMSVGANDSQWIQFAQGCYQGDCKTLIHEANAQVYIADFRIKLLGLLQRIQGKSDGNPPTVLLNEYYKIFSDATCPGTEHISDAEKEWINDVTVDLNQALRDVSSQFDFVHTVSLDSFDDHGLCSTDPWVQGIDDPAPLHPTVNGQVAIADANWHVLLGKADEPVRQSTPQVLGRTTVDCLPQLSALGRGLDMFRTNWCPVSGSDSKNYAGGDPEAPALFAHY